LIYKGLHFAGRHIGNIIRGAHYNGAWLDGLKIESNIYISIRNRV